MKVTNFALLLTLSITEAFLLPREMNLGAVKIKNRRNDDDQEKRFVAIPKNVQEDSTFFITLLQAFESHPKFANVWVSLMKSKPVFPENIHNLIQTGPFTPRAWLEMKRGI